uniref:Uncharacterized protein n=1 Tax=Plectus sambesii TaxID=2011161 RepID=A0A914WDQ4_9BILA
MSTARQRLNNRQLNNPLNHWLEAVKQAQHHQAKSLSNQAPIRLQLPNNPSAKSAFNQMPMFRQSPNNQRQKDRLSRQLAVVKQARLHLEKSVYNQAPMLLQRLSNQQSNNLLNRQLEAVRHRGRVQHHQERSAFNRTQMAAL